MKVDNFGRWGNAYEIRVGAQFVEEGKNVRFINKAVPARTAGGIDLTTTDIDIVADGVYYQVKRSGAVFLGGLSQGKALEKTVQWVTKARADSIAEGIIPPVIKYVTQDLNDVPKLIGDFLESKGIPILPIAGPAPP